MLQSFFILTITSLLFNLFLVTSANAEVPELVRVLASGDNTKVITQLLLLKVPLGEVLQLTLGEAQVGGGGDSELGSVTGDGNIVGSKVSSLVVDLDTVMEVLLEGSNIQDLIVDGLRTVDDEFNSGFLACFDLVI